MNKKHFRIIFGILLIFICINVGVLTQRNADLFVIKTDKEQKLKSILGSANIQELILSSFNVGCQDGIKDAYLIINSQLCDLQDYVISELSLKVIKNLDSRLQLMLSFLNKSKISYENDRKHNALVFCSVLKEHIETTIHKVENFELLEQIWNFQALYIKDKLIIIRENVILLMSGIVCIDIAYNIALQEIKIYNINNWISEQDNNHLNNIEGSFRKVGNNFEKIILLICNKTEIDSLLVSTLDLIDTIIDDALKLFNKGKINELEYTTIMNFCLNILNLDSDEDDLIDWQEYLVYNTDFFNDDTDEDGMPDGWEVNMELNPLFDDSNFDKDEDGMPNLWEYLMGLCANDSSDAFEDKDNDGLINLKEYENGTDAQDDDSDDDGLSDGKEVLIYGTDPLDGDSDDDGLSDGEEVLMYSTDPLDADSDDDGLSDGEEVLMYGTDPLDGDSDDDGLSDGQEVLMYGTDPLDSDSDDDGLSDGQEVLMYGTNPLDGDSDDDGLSDGQEVLMLGTDPLDGDSDDDGLSDGEEMLMYSTDPLDADSDDDGLSDGQEVLMYSTDPLDADSDDDGLSDGQEVLNYGTDPLDGDSDDDGLIDSEEILVYGTNPNNHDTDFDGLLDGDEVLVHNTDPHDSDSDGDSFTDYEEINVYFTDPNTWNINYFGIPLTAIQYEVIRAFELIDYIEIKSERISFKIQDISVNTNLDVYFTISISGKIPSPPFKFYVTGSANFMVDRHANLQVLSYGVSTGVMVGPSPELNVYFGKLTLNCGIGVKIKFPDITEFKNFELSLFLIVNGEASLSYGELSATKKFSGVEFSMVNVFEDFEYKKTILSGSIAGVFDEEEEINLKDILTDYIYERFIEDYLLKEAPRELAAPILHGLGYAVETICDHFEWNTLFTAGYTIDELKDGGAQLMELLESGINGIIDLALEAWDISTNVVSGALGALYDITFDKIFDFWGGGGGDEDEHSDKGDGQIRDYKLFCDIDNLDDSQNGEIDIAIITTEDVIWHLEHKPDCDHCDQGGDNIWVSADDEIIGMYLFLRKDSSVVVKLDEIDVMLADDDGDGWEWHDDILAADADLELIPNTEYWFYWGRHA